MNTQIYLMLVRKVNPNLPTAAKVAAMLKNFVGGDSLDVPFVKFIRVQSVSHSIGFGGEESVTQVEDGVARTYKTDTGGSASDYDPTNVTRRVHKDTGLAYDVHANRWGHTITSGITKARMGGGRQGGFFSRFKNNQYLNINLPDHDNFTFTKSIDNATPQLSYGCSAQEPFYFAAFFFRRRIGAGINGVRLPFMTLGLTKCLITGWSLEDETEKVTLKYKDIMWSTWDQIADVNVPTGASARVWNTETQEGGEDARAYLLQALVGALSAGAGAAFTSDEVQSG